MNLFAAQDKVYNSILSRAIARIGKRMARNAITTQANVQSMLQLLLGTLCVVISPMSLSALSRLIHIPCKDLRAVCEELHGILNVPNNADDPLSFHESSFPQFLQEENRCQEPGLRVDLENMHSTMTKNCITLLSNFLKEDLFSVRSPGVFASSITIPQLERIFPPEMQYACLSWTQHLDKGITKLGPICQILEFMKTHLLHWLEALSWLRRFDYAAYALQTLIELASVRSPNSPNDYLLTFIRIRRILVL